MLVSLLVAAGVVAVPEPDTQSIVFAVLAWAIAIVLVIVFSQSNLQPYTRIIDLLNSQLTLFVFSLVVSVMELRK